MSYCFLSTHFLFIDDRASTVHLFLLLIMGRYRTHDLIIDLGRDSTLILFIDGKNSIVHLFISLIIPHYRSVIMNIDIHLVGSLVELYRSSS